MRNGKLITIEGISGSDRTTHLHHLAQYLIDCGQTVLDLREPLCTKAARHRKAIAEQNAAIIDTALKGGCIVLAEGFFDCEISWQDELPDVAFQNLVGKKRATGSGIKPDLSFVLESDLGAGWTSAPGSHSTLSGTEISAWINSEIFCEKAEAWWLEITARADWPVYLISAQQSPALIQQQMIHHTNQLLNRAGAPMPFLLPLHPAKTPATPKPIKFSQQATV